MLAGHYGVSFGLKAADKSIPLWVLFLAVQWIDVMWTILILLGIEKVRIVPGFTALNPLDLYYYPYTHGLDAALLWSLAAALVYRLLRKRDGWPAAWIVGAAVFSHWVLDFLVHAPDLPLFGNRSKVGLGLWNDPIAASLLEAATLFGGLYLYLRATRPVTPSGRYAMPVFVLVMAAIQVAESLGPAPSDSRTMAAIGLICYLAFTLVAWWLEKTRQPVSAPERAHAAIPPGV